MARKSAVLERRRVEPMRVTSGYFDAALYPDEVIANARESLARVDFDTLVATGLSGTSLAMMVAHALGKGCLLVRKADDTSTHSHKRAWGELGERWVFFDDFIVSGDTRHRVIDAVAQLVADENERRASNMRYAPGHPDADRWAMVPDPLSAFSTKYVGDYTYNYGGEFQSAEEGECK